MAESRVVTVFLVSLSIQLIPQFAYAQIPADLNLPAAEAPATSAPAPAGSSPPAKWSPPARCEVVDVPDESNSKIPIEKANEMISQFEKTCFNKVFNTKSIDDRLDKLELRLFGMGRMGDSSSRIRAIRAALNPDEAVKRFEARNSAPAATPDETKLSALEKRFYEKEDFSAETPEERLLRLEDLVFGQSKTGEVHSRLIALQDAVKQKDEAAAKAAELAKRVASTGDTNFENVKHKTFQDAMDAGLVNFKQKRYHHAQDDFEQALKFNPQSPQAYADLGNTLMMLKDKDSAQEAFKACYALSPFGELGQYARSSLMKLSHDEAYEKTDPQDSPQMVATATRLLNRQARDLGNRHMSDAQVFANNRLILGDIEANKIAFQTQQTIAGIRADAGYGYGGRGYGGGYGYGGYGGGYGGRYDPLGIGEVSDMGYIRSNYVRTDAQVQANNALIEGTKMSASAYDSAANLKDQMLKPGLPGDAKLRALGTCLYARYYGDGMPSRTDDPPLVDPPPPALHATAKLLSPSIHAIESHNHE